MRVSKECRDLFRKRTRDLGREIHEGGRVNLVRPHDSILRAEVRGMGTQGVHNVGLLDPMDVLDFECDCAAYLLSGSCEHIWATLLEADEIGWHRPDPEEPLAEPDQPERRGDRWRAVLQELQPMHLSRQPSRWSQEQLGEKQIIYVLQWPEFGSEGFLDLSVREQRTEVSGKEPTSSPLLINEQAVSGAARDDDRRILAWLAGRTQNADYNWTFGYGSRPTRGHHASIQLVGEDVCQLLPDLVRTGRTYWMKEAEDARLEWDDGGPWQLRARIETRADGTLGLFGAIERGDQVHLLRDARLILPSLMIMNRRVVTVAKGTDHTWMSVLYRERLQGVPAEDHDEFLKTLLAMDPPPPLELPEGWSRQTGEPLGRIVVRRESAPTQQRKRPRLMCELFFDYGDGLEVAAVDPNPIAGRTSEHTLVIRDFDAERTLARRVLEFGRRGRDDDTLDEVTVAASRLPALVQSLIRDGWTVEAEGQLYRRGNPTGFSVSSGVDWFEVKGGIDFGGQQVTLPRLLRELRRGSNLVRLDDGTVGVLPEQWLEGCGRWLALGEAGDDAVRYPQSQGWMLDALLAARGDVETDAGFERYRDRLHSFAGIGSRRERRSFCGQLRDYQREALGWFEFLREFGFGGCLADDMGLGKTVQLLAFLEELRVSRRATGPHLVVAPRSVVGNWIREAARFTPGLDVLDYSGGQRSALRARMASAHLVVTSYGTMRRDIRKLCEQRFDVVVLDEAQAIKNASSQTAKASRLLDANQRLALSGTPIENHLGELWSLFEFLNPGMLGKAGRFQSLIGGRKPSDDGAAAATGRASTAGTPDTNADTGNQNSAVKLLSDAVRPFIFRRTKAQVLTELPQKTEQTIICELGTEQRQLYDELRDHYRARLLAAVESRGLGRTKMQVLEALLRLRQAACHPGLLDRQREGERSAKLEVLLAQLTELRGEGHKALVFSQFTRFLGLVRRALDAAGIPWEYLDGRTRNREACIDRFQEDPSCTVFLISLKAGGLGLNLTAADYVFILDPWWNPAAEAQAIDRTHRLGQIRPVFAYRLICSDTVEEKIVALQHDKRELAESVIRADEGLMRRLTRDDLATLLA